VVGGNAKNNGKQRMKLATRYWLWGVLIGLLFYVLLSCLSPLPGSNFGRGPLPSNDLALNLLRLTYSLFNPFVSKPWLDVLSLLFWPWVGALLGLVIDFIVVAKSSGKATKQSTGSDSPG
jgi:hypothetical protein